MQTFEDINANGVQDAGEPPLAGVKVSVSDAKGNGGYGGSWTSDSAGKAYIAFFRSCNETPQFVLSAVIPQGYSLTTPEFIDAGSEAAGTFSFGFVRKK